MALSTARTAPPAPSRAPRVDRLDLWYAGAVVVGMVLMVIAALNQPYNQNEIAQIRPYNSFDPGVIASGTRQPPLAPLLGSAAQHLFGVGQLQQRLVPILSGVGVLMVVGFLMRRRLGLGAAGALALWVMATAPLMVRYGAYERPYMLPLFFMLLFVLAADEWLRGGHFAWLVLGFLTVVAMLFTRVPEPITFLMTTVLVLSFLALRRRMQWSRVLPVIAMIALALGGVGYPAYRALASKTSARVFDPSIGGIIERFGSGVHEIVTHLASLLATWMPWWPVTVLVAVASVAFFAPRRQQADWWFVLPLLAAPVAFALAYHFLNKYPFDGRPYAPRFALFFVPPFIFAVAALGRAVTTAGIPEKKVRMAVAALLAVALIGQLPKTARVLTTNEAADFAQAAQVLTDDVPKDAIVFYDTPSPIGHWRQPFSANPRYIGNKPFVAQILSVNHHLGKIPKSGPPYFLMLSGRCSYLTSCQLPPSGWSGKVPGWTSRRVDKFTLYTKKSGPQGRDGVIAMLQDFESSLGAGKGYRYTYIAAALLERQGRTDEGKALISAMLASTSTTKAERIQKIAEKRGLDPFAS